MDVKEYVNLKESHEQDYRLLKSNYNRISLLRLLCAIVFITSFFYYLKYNDSVEWVILISLVCFIFLMMKHRKLDWEMKLKKALIDINDKEIKYLNQEEILFEDGLEFSDTDHSYAHDLDFFGKKSLFHHLNRTATYIGKVRLSSLLLKLLPNNEILKQQGAINELKENIKWRQDVNAISIVTSDSKNSYYHLLEWCKIKSKTPSNLLTFLSYFLPLLTICSLIYFAFSHESKAWSIFVIAFLSNLVVLLFQLKNIKLEIFKSDKMHEIVKRYGLVLALIENENFESEKLNELKQKLSVDGKSASYHIQSLSSLFSRMDSIQNGMGAILFNGFLLYHIHTLKSLILWRNNFASHIPIWLDVIGDIEALNSLANYSFNNNEFIFPSINTNNEIVFKELGHPLIHKSKRVNNSIDFTRHRFVILTGSNMSGKSTFLRTLGINMVLAGIGAPICASSANINPMRVWVSMRVSDSLTESESYFFAEVKRLKEIIDNIKQEQCFVLLDEILRGTNSDDKRNGTIEVIKKMLPSNVVGAIATHDLEVCETTFKYPNYLANKCFEVEIVNNDLSFDFKLRDGICKNKSATFLMKKMEII